MKDASFTALVYVARKTRRAGPRKPGAARKFVPVAFKVRPANPVRRAETRGLALPSPTGEQGEAAHIVGCGPT
jgi:hypothetical protein